MGAELEEADIEYYNEEIKAHVFDPDDNEDSVEDEPEEEQEQEEE